MSDTKELLELAALAMGYTSPIQMLIWNPLNRQDDCADMCAALGIGTNWCPRTVICIKGLTGQLAEEEFTDHNNDRAAAWRMAALRVAAAIGEAMK